MLTLAAIALVLPAAFQAGVGTRAFEGLGKLSISISIVLLLVYLLYLVFTLVTHSALFSGSYVPEEGAAHALLWSVCGGVIVLLIARDGFSFMFQEVVGEI